jgi:hypothetical protein
VPGRPLAEVMVIQTDADAVIREYVSGKLSFRGMRSTLFTPKDRVRGNVPRIHHNMWSAEQLIRDYRVLDFEATQLDAGSWALDTHDALCEEDVLRDRGKRIRNLGVGATKR